MLHEVQPSEVWGGCGRCAGCDPAGPCRQRPCAGPGARHVRRHAARVAGPAAEPAAGNEDARGSREPGTSVRRVHGHVSADWTPEDVEAYFCAEPRSYQVKGVCDRCAVRDRLGTLFSTVPDDGCGAYAHMRAALIECPEPGTVLNWLRNSRSARLLADLIATGRPLTHLDLDATAGDGRAAPRTVDYLRVRGRHRHRPPSGRPPHPRSARPRHRPRRPGPGPAPSGPRADARPPPRHRRPLATTRLHRLDRLTSKPVRPPRRADHRSKPRRTAGLGGVACGYPEGSRIF